MAPKCNVSFQFTIPLFLLFLFFFDIHEPGKQAILRIYNPTNPNKIQETIQIYHLQTRTEMHELLQRKGFVKKAKNDIQQLQMTREDQHAINAKRGYVESHRGVIRIQTPPGWTPPAKQHGKRLQAPPHQPPPQQQQQPPLPPPPPGHLRGNKIHSSTTTNAVAAPPPLISSPLQGNGSTEQQQQQQQQHQELEARSQQEPSVGGTGMEIPESAKVTEGDTGNVSLHKGDGPMSPFPGSSSTNINSNSSSITNDILIYVPIQLALVMIGMVGLVWGMIQRRRRGHQQQLPQQQQQGRRLSVFGGCQATRFGPFFLFCFGKSSKEERTSQ
jgi:hypothetical protein